MALDGELEYRDRPCSHCPWRVDTDLADFSDADFDKLRAANGTQGAEAPMSAPIMACTLTSRTPPTRCGCAPGTWPWSAAIIWVCG